MFNIYLENNTLLLIYLIRNYLNFLRNIFPAKKTIIHNAYILIVRENVSATNPIIAGANNKAEKPIVVKLVTVVGILSDEYLTACRIIIGTKFAVAKP